MMNIDTKPRNRIKKIFLDGIMHLGDVITAASVIPVLKEQYPHSEIHYLVKDSVALPASLICGVDRVIPYLSKRRRGLGCNPNGEKVVPRGL